MLLGTLSVVRLFESLQAKKIRFGVYFLVHHLFTFFHVTLLLSFCLQAFWLFSRWKYRALRIHPMMAQTHFSYRSKSNIQIKIKKSYIVVLFFFRLLLFLVLCFLIDKKTKT